MMANTSLSQQEPDLLDLYDLCLLLNYERTSTEPRFRHAKLIEIAADHGDTPFSEMPTFGIRGWGTRGQYNGYLFEQDATKNKDTTPDLPSNMLADPPPASLSHLTSYELETIFWQARAHDGCFKAMALLQFFFDQYPPTQPLRVRTTTGEEFMTTTSHSVIMEWDIQQPKKTLLAIVRGKADEISYISGQDDTLIHAVWGMAALDGENVSAILDLSSMQFGETGRGLKSKSTFTLESLDQFYDRLNKIAGGLGETKTSKRIGPTPVDDWLKDVASRAKARWDARDSHPWCGHCGAPSNLAKPKKCTLCKVHYCNAAHQKLAWPFHKKFCSGKLGQ